VVLAVLGGVVCGEGKPWGLVLFFLLVDYLRERIKKMQTKEA
jgi:hypothetical protein